MDAPRIKAMLAQGTLVIADEFTWGLDHGHAMRWRIVDIDGDEITALSIRAYEEPAFGELDLSSDPRLFTLTADQVAQMMPQEADRVPDGDNRNWWLSDEGGAPGFKAYVHNNGWINEYGAEASSGYAAIRPAVRFSLEDITFELSGSSSGDEDDASSILDIASLEDPSPVLASAYGEELVLEALEADDLFLLEEFLSVFGVHHSWETMFADALAKFAQDGDSAQVNRLLHMCGQVESMGQALAAAMAEGHMAAAGTLIRAGAQLDGGITSCRLVGDTAEHRHLRKASYPSEAQLCQQVFHSQEGAYSVKTLMRQNLINGRNYHALLRGASKEEESRELFQWMLCPDFQSLGKLYAYVAKKKVCLTHQHQANSAPVSQQALQMLWYPQLVQDNPQLARGLSVYLTDSSMEGKRELICFLARENCVEEIERILAGKKVFSPKDLAAAAEVASAAGHKGLSKTLRTFLRSIGAGKLVASD